MRLFTHVACPPACPCLTEPFVLSVTVLGAEVPWPPEVHGLADDDSCVFTGAASKEQLLKPGKACSSLPGWSADPIRRAEGVSVSSSRRLTLATGFRTAPAVLCWVSCLGSLLRGRPGSRTEGVGRLSIGKGGVTVCGFPRW